MTVQKFLVILKDDLQFDANDIYDRIKNYGMYEPKELEVLKQTEDLEKDQHFAGDLTPKDSK